MRTSDVYMQHPLVACSRLLKCPLMNTHKTKSRQDLAGSYKVLLHTRDPWAFRYTRSLMVLNTNARYTRDASFASSVHTV